VDCLAAKQLFLFFLLLSPTRYQEGGDCAQMRVEGAEEIERVERERRRFGQKSQTV
jgi:hypothetical protein